jgi:energy-coupling factor transporter ATP-binding protein EcfA2
MQATQVNTQNQIDTAVDAIQSVSGLTGEQAKTCIYYAVMTYLLDSYPDDYLIPILCLQGNSGTGKSKAVKLMAKLVNDPTMLNGRGKTFSEIAIDLNGATTALIEEADVRQSRVETQLIQLRTERRHKNQVINMPPQATPVQIENFGATIVEKRVPFSDAAVRNRTITIKTVRREGDYQEVGAVDIDGAGLRNVADYVRQNAVHLPASDRVMESWRPLIEIAGALGDFDWVIHLDEEYKRARKMLAVGDQYESEDVLIKAVIAAGGLSGAVKLKDIRESLEHNFDLKWSSQKVHTTLTSLGFETNFDGKYDRLVNAGDLLRRLATERNIPLEP